MNVETVPTQAQIDPSASALLNDALAGLTADQKALDPKWLYDSIGSGLFEDITVQPEYYLTRTETALLRRHADTLAALVPAGGALVEFGSGASVKTRTLLDSGTHIGTYVPVDISADFLHATAADLRARYPDLTVTPVVGDFLHPVPLPDTLQAAPKVGFFPGSTLGNIAPSAALELLIRARHWPGVGAFILGVDLVKDASVLEAAYDDAAGVTRAFISNILARLNKELRADFDLAQFTYEATWNPALARIEMALVSDTAQQVHLGGQDISFTPGEKIAISQSRKYTVASIEKIAQESGWALGEMITDADEQFAVAVLTT